MLAQVMRLPSARAQRHTQVLEEMHRADPSKMKSLDMIMGTGPVDLSMSHLVCTPNRSLRLVLKSLQVMVETAGTPVAEMRLRCQMDERLTLYSHVMIKHFILIYEDNLCRRCLGSLNDKKAYFSLLVSGYKTQKR